MLLISWVGWDVVFPPFPPFLSFHSRLAASTNICPFPHNIGVLAHSTPACLQRIMYIREILDSHAMQWFTLDFLL